MTKSEWIPVWERLPKKERLIRGGREAMKSCATCKYFRQETEDHGYCEYPVPAWLIISVGSPGRDMSLMPSRYAPCPTWQLNDEELLSQKEEPVEVEKR